MNSLRGMPASRTAMIMISFSSWRISLTCVAQVADQRLEHARRELELHELVGEALADLERLRILRAHLLDVRERVREVLADRGEAARGLFRIRAGVDGFLFFAGAVAFFVSSPSAFSSGTGGREIHLGGVLRLRDDVRRVRVDDRVHRHTDAFRPHHQRRVTAGSMVVSPGRAFNVVREPRPRRSRGWCGPSAGRPRGWPGR